MSYNLNTVCSLPSNYFNPACNCINPPIYIKNIADNVLAPYYCWYAPCLTANAIKTPEIIQGQLDCKIKNCSISIDQIKTTGGVINIQNSCATQFTNVKNLNISLEKIDFKLKLPVFDFSILLLMVSTSLLLS